MSSDNNEEFEFCAACQIDFGCEISQSEPEPENKENEENESQMISCKKCEFWDKFKDDPNKGVCKHPERNDKKSVHYYGFIKCNSYCAKFSKKVGK